jgi:SAM-dependent methyltransferase
MPTPEPSGKAVSGAGASLSRCPLCGATGLQTEIKDAPDRLHATPGVSSVQRCSECGGGVTLPRVGPDELAAFYPSTYNPYVPARGALAAVSALIQRLQARRAERSAPLRALADRPPGRLLDVGAGRGDLAAHFVGRGWQVTAVEPSQQACEVLAARGIDARCGTLGDVELDPAAYDAATFNHALEHVTDPLADLELVARALAPGGLVLISVPNFGGWQRRRFGSRWFHLDLPRHRVHFSEAALRAVLERAGFEPLELSTSTSGVGLAASIQYAVAGRCLFPEGMKLRVASLAALALWPLARVFDALGGGDVLHAVARRP